MYKKHLWFFVSFNNIKLSANNTVKIIFLIVCIIFHQNDYNSYDYYNLHKKSLFGQLLTSNFNVVIDIVLFLHFHLNL